MYRRLPPTREQRIQKQVSGLPASVTRFMLETHGALALQPLEPLPNGTRRDSAIFAEAWLEDTADALKAAKLTRAYDDEAIRDYANNYSRLAARCSSLESKESFARAMGIQPPSGKSLTKEGRVRRLECPKWWRGQLRKAWTRSAEDERRGIGMTRKGRQAYVSDEAVQHHAARRERTREWMESRVMVNEEGEQLCLLEIHKKSLANPALRRGEFMCRVRGFEEYADSQGHVADFWTLTAPSAFHAQLSSGGLNPRWDAAAKPRVRAGQKMLVGLWAIARAKLARLSIRIYGVRVAEPHHDGTPHWHMLIFMRPEDRETVRRVVSGVWCSVYRDELTGPEAVKARQFVKSIDRTRGSAVGYVAKYVAKNIDAAGGIGDDISDETGRKVSEGVQRVAAWAATYGIRQFQQVGGPVVGIWREARRLKNPADDGEIERVRLAADGGDWSGYIRALSPDGVRSRRDRAAVALEKKQTGECNRYGELRAAQIVGIRSPSGFECTRPHVWRIEKKGACGRQACGSGFVPKSNAAGLHASFSSVFSSLGPVAITVRGAPEGNAPAGWSNPRENSRAGPQ